MKSIKIILSISLCILLFSCEKDRFPTVENAAMAQFTRELATPPAATATYNNATLSKAAPATTDKFALKIVDEGSASSVKIMVDYRKGTTTTAKQFNEITSWPANYTVSLNDLIALFSSNGVTLANVAAGDRFVFRTVVTLKSGTIVSEQAATLLAAPYATTLTYTVAN